MGTTLISANWLVPICAAPVRGGAVCVDHTGLVLDMGRADELAPRWPSARAQHVDGTLLPGLVNAHTHLELSALAGAVDGGDGLVAWVGRLLPQQKQLSTHDRQGAIRTAINDLWRWGTAGLGDVGNGLLAPLEMAGGPLQGSFFHEILGSRDTASGDGLLAGLEDYRAVCSDGAWPERFTYVQAPHAPYSADPHLLKRLFLAASQGGTSTSIHVAEDPQELALLLHQAGDWVQVLRRLGVDPASRAPGLSPVPYLREMGAFAQGARPLLVHMCHATAADIDAAAAAEAPIVLCPRSNLHITGQLPDVEKMLAAGVGLALGTDSLASNQSLSLWDEMATLSARWPQVPAHVWLDAATRGGAQALQRPQLGSIAPGQRPGLISLNLNEPDPVRALVNARPEKVSWMVRA